MDNNFKVNQVNNTLFNPINVNKDPQKEKQQPSSNSKNNKKKDELFQEEEKKSSKNIKINDGLGKFIDLKL